MNRIIEVFTRKYKEEIKYREFMKHNIDYFKLKSDNYDVNTIINNLGCINFNKNIKSV